MPSYVKGSTSQIMMLHILDDTSTVGAGKTGLTNASVTAHYRRADDGDAGATAISLSAGTRGTWGSGHFKEVDATNMPGTYEFGVPNAMLATGAEEVSLHVNGSGIRMAPQRIELLEPVSDLFQQVVSGGGAPTWDAGSAGETLKDLNDKMPTNFIMGSSDASDQDDNIAAVKAETALIVADTNEVQTDLADGGRIDLLVDAIKAVTDALPDAGALTTISTNITTVDTVVDAIKAVTDLLPNAGALSDLATILAELTTLAGEVSAILADTGTDGVVLASASNDAIADAILDRSNGVETSITPRQALRAILASACGVLSGVGSGTYTFKNTAGSTTRLVVTVDATGRTSVTTTL